jgi:hypothetical protein
MKLTLDELELLHELVNSPGWSVLLKKVDRLASNIDSRVLSYNLDDGAEKLVQAKARSEGSRQLQLAIIGIKNDFKQADKGL